MAGPRDRRSALVTSSTAPYGFAGTGVRPRKDRCFARFRTPLALRRRPPRRPRRSGRRIRWDRRPKPPARVDGDRRRGGRAFRVVPAGSHHLRGPRAQGADRAVRRRGCRLAAGPRHGGNPGPRGRPRLPARADAEPAAAAAPFPVAGAAEARAVLRPDRLRAHPALGGVLPGVGPRAAVIGQLLARAAQLLGRDGRRERARGHDRRRPGRPRRAGGGAGGAGGPGAGRPGAVFRCLARRGVEAGRPRPRRRRRTVAPRLGRSAVPRLARRLPRCRRARRRSGCRRVGRHSRRSPPRCRRARRDARPIGLDGGGARRAAVRRGWPGLCGRRRSSHRRRRHPAHAGIPRRHAHRFQRHRVRRRGGRRPRHRWRAPRRGVVRRWSGLFRGAAIGRRLRRRAAPGGLRRPPRLVLRPAGARQGGLPDAPRGVRPDNSSRRSTALWSRPSWRRWACSRRCS